MLFRARAPWLQRRTNSIYQVIPDQDVRSQFRHFHLKRALSSERAVLCRCSVWSLFFPKASTPCCTPLPGPHILTRRNQVESTIVMLQHASQCSLLHLITTWPGREVFGSDAGGQGSSRKATQMIQIQHASKQCLMNVKDYYGQIWSVVAWDSRFRDCSVVAVDLVEEAMHEVLKLSNQPTAQLLHSMAWGWHQLQHADWGFGTQKRSIAAVKLNSSWILLDIAGTLVDFSKFPAIILHSRVKNAGGLQMLTRSHESWYGPPQLLSFSIEGSWFPQTFCFLCRVEDYEGEPNSDTKLFPFHTHVCLHSKWTPKAHVRCGDTRQPGHRAESDTDSKHIYLDQPAAELQTFWG